MGFFDSLPAPPPPERPRRPRPPEWFHPGRNVVPAALAVDGLLVHRPALAVFLGSLEVYPNGFSFEVTVLRRRVAGRVFDVREDSPFGPFRLRTGEQVDDPGRFLRFGVQYADGRATAARTGFPRPDPAAPPERPYMVPHHGHGGEGDWEQAYWIWGLPEHGDVSLVYSWGDEDVPESRFELDGEALRAASARARVLWEEAPEDES